MNPGVAGVEDDRANLMKGYLDRQPDIQLGLPGDLSS